MSKVKFYDSALLALVAVLAFIGTSHVTLLAFNGPTALVSCVTSMILGGLIGNFWARRIR